MAEPKQLRPVVVCSILERDAESTAGRIESAPRGCGLIEIRGDHLRAEELALLVRRATRPALATVRRLQDGGGFSGSEEERRRALVGALEAGAELIDVEWAGRLEPWVEAIPRERRLLSHHGGPCRVERLERLHAEMSTVGAARLKIVPSARSLAEAIGVRELLARARAGPPLACFAMGRAGAITRLLAPAWGSWATYGSSARGAESAAGQFPAAEMLETHDVLGIGPATALFALIGRAVFGSPSPAIHRAGYAAIGLDARYLPVEIDAVEESTELVERLGIRALAVTMPFKESMARRCAVLDGPARSSGAVNTVVVGPEGWRGHDTDGPAALAAIQTRLAPRDLRVAIVGAGGTARAVAAALAGAGARVTLYARAPRRANAAARALGVAARPLERLASARWDLLVQATPLGRRGERVLPDGPLAGRLVLDAVYGADATPLVVQAARQGRIAIDGLELLARQAALQFEWMTGARPDLATLERVGREWIRSRT